jgi:formylmethanofuran dehydrogenase subunit E
MASQLSKETIEQIVQFHGHMCPGLAIGIRVGEVALREVGSHSNDEEVVAQVETDMCAVDAVQYLTGCTYGKGNLLHRDWGKNAFTFWRRSDGHSVRVVANPDALAGPETEEWRTLFAKVRAGMATEQERARFDQLHLARSQAVLDASEEDILQVHPNEVPVPRSARIHRSIRCAACGEATMETRVRLLEDRYLCPPCFEAATER